MLQVLQKRSATSGASLMLLSKHSFMLHLFFFFCCVALFPGFWFPHQQLNPSAQQWEHQVLNTGPPGSSLLCYFLISQTMVERKIKYLHSCCLNKVKKIFFLFLSTLVFTSTYLDLSKRKGNALPGILSLF